MISFPIFGLGDYGMCFTLLSAMFDADVKGYPTPLTQEEKLNNYRLDGKFFINFLLIKNFPFFILYFLWEK
jgi:hypothetical protein